MNNFPAQNVKSIAIQRAAVGAVSGLVGFGAAMLISEPLQSLLVPDYTDLEAYLFSKEIAPVLIGASVLLGLVCYVILSTRRLVISILLSAIPAFLAVIAIFIAAPTSEEGPQFALLITPLTAFAIALFWLTCLGLERIRLSC